MYIYIYMGISFYPPSCGTPTLIQRTVLQDRITRRRRGGRRGGGGPGRHGGLQRRGKGRDALHNILGDRGTVRNGVYCM